jgi:uncharacterized secreted protein with C-terminal beta-propeller domain
MSSLRRISILAGVAVLATAALEGASARPGASSAGSRLVAFRSCPDLVTYARAHAKPFVSAYGLGGGRTDLVAKGAPVPSAALGQAGAAREDSALQQGVDYSGTNVQEEGVDEPDLVKTDGRTVFAIANGTLNAVAVNGGKPQLLDTLKLNTVATYELLLHGKRLLVIGRGGYWAEPLPASAKLIMPYQPASSVLTEVDVSDPKALEVVRTLELDGAYVAARLVGSTVRLVASSQVPASLPFVQPANGAPEAVAFAKRHNASVLANARVGKWLPSYRIKRAGHRAGREHAAVQCRRVTRPASFSGLGMLTVLTIDLAKGLEPVDSTALMTDARIVYASQENLYVATERWADRPDPAQPQAEQPGATTAIHRFDITNPAKSVYRGSGKVSGFLLSQWSLSEFKGVLRVVSTETPAWWGAGGDSESFLTTLRLADNGLDQVGRVGELGKGERVYAVRFVGDTGYVVTFRQVDPLYTVDLADPAKPRVLGELKIPGYSAYLHPIGEDLLLGIGQDADENGRTQGTQISIFDVSDLRKPTRLHTKALGLGWSEAESDHHAFLYWPASSLVVVPFEQKAVGFKVGRARGVDELGRVDNGAGGQEYTPPIRRSLVAGGSLLTVSDAGVKASSLTSLAEQGFAAFPAPQPVKVPTPGSTDPTNWVR